MAVIIRSPTSKPAYMWLPDSSSPKYNFDHVTSYPPAKTAVASRESLFVTGATYLIFPIWVPES